jgi:glycosyltransferase involved in cell wall biosynthesis
LPASPLRVLTVFVGLQIGGSQEAFLRSLPHFDRRAVEHVVCCLGDRGPLVPEAEAMGVPVVSLGRLRSDNDIGAVPALARALRRERVDIVQTHLYTRARPYAQMAALLARRPGMLVIASGRSKSERLKFRLADGLLMRFTDRFVAHCEAVRTAVVGDYGLAPDKVTVVHPGIEPRGFERGVRARAGALAALRLPEGATVIGAVARLETVKGIDCLLAAMPSILARHPAARLAVVGDGSEATRLRGLAADLGMAGRVSFLGARRDVADLLPGFDAFVLPSRHEGYPMALLEAMAAGCAVVASRVGGVPEAVEDGRSGLLVEPEAPAALARAVAALLDDPALRGRLGEAARRHALTRCTARDYARALESVYRALAPREGRSIPGKGSRP